MSEAWLDTVLGRLLQAAGVPLVKRSNLNFRNGLTVTDDPATNTTHVDATGGGGGGGATVVADPAALRSLSPPTSGTQAVIKGTSKLYGYSAELGANFPDNGQRVIKPDSVITANPGRWFLLSSSGEYLASDYGMDPGASATANVAALVAAISAASTAGGGVVKIPAGVFNWKVPTFGNDTGCFNMGAVNGVTVRGSGRYKTILRDLQAPSTGNSINANGSGANGFFSILDWTNCVFESFGLQGALVYGATSLQSYVIDITRKGFYLRNGSAGCQNVVVRDVYLNQIEGECWLVEGNVTHPAKNCYIEDFHAYQILSNVVNINSGLAGAYYCGGRSGRVEDGGNGTPFQTGGNGSFFYDVDISYPSHVGIGAEIARIEQCDNVDMHDIRVDGLRLIAGAAMILLLDQVQCHNVKLHHIKFTDCSMLGMNGGAVGGIITLGAFTGGGIHNVDVHDIEAINCWETNGGVSPPLALFRVMGHASTPGTVTGHLGRNTQRVGVHANQVDHGVIVDANALATGLIVDAQQLDSSVTTPYTFGSSVGAGDRAVSNLVAGYVPTITAANRVLLSTSGTGATWGQIIDAMISGVAWSKVTGTPTTKAGYGITDVVSSGGDVTGAGVVTQLTGAGGIVALVTGTNTIAAVDAFVELRQVGGGTSHTHVKVEGDSGPQGLGVYNETLDLADLLLEGTTHSSGLRCEGRNADKVLEQGELQIGPLGAPAVIVGQTATVGMQSQGPIRMKAIAEPATPTGSSIIFCSDGSGGLLTGHTYIKGPSGTVTHLANA